MYKDPQASAKAKLLTQELKALGFNLPHAKALEIIAKVDGGSNLHVAQAKAAKARPSEQALAEEHATRLMFKSLGSFEDAGVRKLFETLNTSDVTAGPTSSDEPTATPVMQPVYEAVPPAEWPALFARLVSESLELVLRLRTQPQRPNTDADHVLYSGPMRDWKQDARAEEMTARERRTFQMTAKRSFSQYYLDVALEGDTFDDAALTDQLGVVIEINNGFPCLHLTNRVFGDTVLSIFATADGFWLRPDGYENALKSGIPSESRPALAELNELDRKFVTTCLFIET